MKSLQTTTLADALAQWGRHEAEGRHKDQLKPPPSTPVDFLNVLLHTRPNMVAHLLKREPHHCLQVALAPTDADVLRLSNGQTLDDWIAHVQSLTDPASMRHVHALVGAESPPDGPVLVVGTLAGDNQDTQDQARIEALTLYDGWHRTAAWLLRCRAQRPSMLLANLVLARRTSASP